MLCLKGPDAGNFELDNGLSNSRLTVEFQHANIPSHIRRLRLLTRVLLDRETKSEHKLLLVATDQSEEIKSRHTAQLPIVIVVREVNEYAPEFDIGSVVTVDNDRTFLGKTRGNRLHPAVSLFPNTNPRSSSSLSDVQITDHLLLTITIDIPENLQLGSRIYRILATDKDYVKISESAGTVRESKVVQYAMATSADLNLRRFFRVGTDDGWITLIHHLDYEAGPRSFHMPVVATDFGRPPKTGSLRIFLRIIDINDEAPVIEVRGLGPVPHMYTGLQTPDIQLSSMSNPQTLTVRENMPPGTFVARIVATDRDTGSAGEVSCFLESPVGPAQMRTSPLLELLDPGSNELPFSVSDFLLKQTSAVYDITGSQSDIYHPLTSQSTVRRREANYVLLTKTLLDREQRELHFLSLVCHDHGDNTIETEGSESRAHLVNSNRRMTSTSIIRIMVLDENDNGPKFQLHNQNVKIQENSAPGTRIVQLSAHDGDAVGLASLTYYRMANSDEVPKMNRSQLRVEELKELFSIDKSNGWLLTGSVRLDRETRDTYVIPVVAYDHEFTNRTSETYICVQVTDANDNAPKLVGNSTFYIEEESGGVFSADEYKSSRSGSRQIFVGHLTAEDLDLKENAQVSFSLNPTHNVTSNSYSGLSWFIRSDGTLFANLSSEGVLDREKQEVYFVSIILRDHSIEQPLSSTATVTISLRDKNDNAPRFLRPPVLAQHHNGNINSSNIVDSTRLNAIRPHVDTLRLAESTSPGTVVYTALATDPDEGENGQVVYKLQPYEGFWQVVHFKSKRNTTYPADTDPNQYFVIDSNSGDVRLNQRVSSLDASLPKKLVIFAEDRGIPTRRSYAFLQIEVQPDLTNLSMARGGGGIKKSIDSLPVLSQSNFQAKYRKNEHAVSHVEEGAFVALSSTFAMPAPDRKLSGNHLDGMYKKSSRSNSVTWNSELITGLGIGLVVIILVCLFLLITYAVHGTRRLNTVNRSSVDQSKRKWHREEQTSVGPMNGQTAQNTAGHTRSFRNAVRQVFTLPAEPKVPESQRTDQEDCSSQHHANAINLGCTQMFKVLLHPSSVSQTTHHADEYPNRIVNEVFTEDTYTKHKIDESSSSCGNDIFTGPADGRLLDRAIPHRPQCSYIYDQKSIPLDQSRFSNECAICHEVTNSNPSPSRYTTLIDRFQFDAYPVRVTRDLQANANYAPLTSFSIEKSVVSPVPSPRATRIKATRVPNREPDTNLKDYAPVDEPNFSESLLKKDTVENRVTAFFPEIVHIPQLLGTNVKAEPSVETRSASATEDVLIKLKQKLGNQSSFV
ncbi:Cadherin domain protein [Paragonimus heterotremus]|uniref:Cadherin domain protein n=1 Tax=Paragonimus heterotremus TaxID=100268 RepID=A0A8J4WIE1_9TREM|nr:Cadherin domain protein [Paragonimus heterotremus]